MNAPKHPSGIADWKLERYLLGELPRGEADRIAALAAADTALSDRLAALREEYRALAAAHPAERMTRRIVSALGDESRAGRAAPRDSGASPAAAGLSPAASDPRRTPAPARSSGSGRRPGPDRSFLRSRIYWAPAFAVLALLAVIPVQIARWHPADPGPDSTETTRLKGQGPRLFLYRKAEGGSAPLAAGGAVRPGELIRIQYDAAGKAHGAIFSIDSDGGVSWHLPDDARGSAPLRNGGRVALEFAFELDSLPGTERFFFIAADRPFRFEADLPWLLSSLRAPGNPAPPLPPGFGLAEINLRKETGT